MSFIDIATSLTVSGLGGSCTGDHMNIGGDLGSSRPVGAYEVIGVCLLIGIDETVPPIGEVDLRTPKVAVEKPKQSSSLGALSMCLCLLSIC